MYIGIAVNSNTLAWLGLYIWLCCTALNSGKDYQGPLFNYSGEEEGLHNWLAKLNPEHYFIKINMLVTDNFTTADIPFLLVIVLLVLLACKGLC